MKFDIYEDRTSGKLYARRVRLGGLFSYTVFENYFDARNKENVPVRIEADTKLALRIKLRKHYKIEDPDKCVDQIQFG